MSSDHACLRANLCKQRHATASHADVSLQALHRDSALTVLHGMRPLHIMNARLPVLLARPCTRALQKAAFPCTALMHVGLSYHHNSALSCSSTQHANKHTHAESSCNQQYLVLCIRACDSPQRHPEGLSRTLCAASGPAQSQSSDSHKHEQDI